MKILIYAHLFPPSKGGMQYQNLEIAQGLHDLGHNVEVIACDNKGATQFVEDLNFPVYLLKKWSFAPMHSLSGISRSNWIFVPAWLLKIRQIIKKTRPDIILIADESANFFWSFLAKFCHIPYVSYCSVPLLAVNRNYYRVNLKRRITGCIKLVVCKMLESSYENAQKIIAVSTSTKNELIKINPKFEAKLSVIPNSIDDRHFNTPKQENSIKNLKNKFGLHESNFVLLSVARLTPDKGLGTVIRAIKNIPETERKRLKYIVVGEGSAMESLKKQVNTCSLTENVVFTGGIPHLDLISYYDLCDLFVLTPERGPMESFGRVFVEAAARSKPSIATKEGGMRDVVDIGKTGFLVAPGDSDAIGVCILKLMRDQQHLKNLGEKARHKAEIMYTSKNVALKFEQLLLEVV